MVRRILLACALLVVAVVGIGGPVNALDVTTRRATDELDVVRTMLHRSLKAYASENDGDTTPAYTLARNARSEEHTSELQSPS